LTVFGEGPSDAVASRVGTGLRNEVRDLAEPVGEVLGEVGICEEVGGVEGLKSGMLRAGVVGVDDEEGSARGVEGAVLNEEAESFERCWSEEGRGGFLGRLYCFGEGIVYWGGVKVKVGVKGV
jgi:hypothetical protein